MKDSDLKGDIDLGHKFAVGALDVSLDMMGCDEGSSVYEEVAECVNRDTNLRPEKAGSNRSEGHYISSICTTFAVNSPKEAEVAAAQLNEFYKMDVSGLSEEAGAVLANAAAIHETALENAGYRMGKNGPDMRFKKNKERFG